ncbi:hypothetical protein VE03_10440, partial [Pseudogymnoascus sp. 23342-1-I1]
MPQRNVVRRTCRNKPLSTKNFKEFVVQNHIIDEPAYIVPRQQQGRVSPRPQRMNGCQDDWESLERVDEISLEDKATIRTFDDILIAAFCENSRKLRKERCRVIECRQYQDDKYYLMVLWWLDRRALEKPFHRTKAYLKKKWPLRAPFKFVLGVHFDIVSSDTVLKKLVSTRRFSKSMMYGGKYFNFEIFSDVPDWTIRSDTLSENGDAKRLLRKEKLQKELYQ